MSEPPVILDPLTQSLSAYGLPGVVIAGLIWAVRRLFKRLDDTQEARIKERDDMLKGQIAALTQAADAADRNAEAIETLTKVIQTQEPTRRRGGRP